MDIFKNVAKKTTSPEDSRCSARKDAATTRSQSNKSEAHGEWIPADKSEIGEAKISDDNIRSSKRVSITHGRTQKNAQHDQSHIIEDEPSPAGNTRSSRRQKLLSAVGVSGVALQPDNVQDKDSR